MPRSGYQCAASCVVVVQIRCADLYGLFAFALCGPMRGGLVTSVLRVVVVQDVIHGPLRTGCICAVRCAFVVRDAIRGPLRTGCICVVCCEVVVQDAMR
jgi:hypothetical protein